MTDRCTRRPGVIWTRCTCDDPRCVALREKVVKLRNAGRRPVIPTDQAWAVFCAMVDAKWSTLAIASATGLPVSTVQGAERHYSRGEGHTFNNVSCRAILGHSQPTAGWVGALGSSRRTQALAAIGRTTAEMTADSGVPGCTIRWVMNARSERVTAVYASAIRVMFDRFRDVPGESRWAGLVRDRAERSGWVAPVFWDGLDMDDPAADPGVAVGDRRVLADLGEAWHLARSGETTAAVAARLGVTRGALMKRLTADPALRDRLRVNDEMRGAA